ncbi:NHL repeat-containing protein [Tenacibaculum agarivorans]|uniref:PQQ-binding-like beta-propeller repeat protein n=1 Tax=Tenacibaculum agarivorans TaxID=1908389 RepID=UPI00094B820E|nr:PQQ-binding-like beta-propeller repeat protein [Tenacibaculum agarivorans]
MRVQFFLAVLIISWASYGQSKVWEKDLKNELYEVGWIKQSNEGNIIASGAKGLLAMNHTNGEIIWHNKELKAVDKKTFLNIEGLPFFYVEYSPVVGKTRGIILNSNTGEIVFDTKDEGYRIKNYTTLNDKGVILFELLENKNRKLMSFDIVNTKLNWIIDLGKVGGIFKFFGGSFIDHGPFFPSENNLIIGVKEQIYAIDFAKGTITWNYEARKKVNALVYSDKNNSLYVGVKKSSKLLVLDPTNGNDITPGKLKLRGTLIDVVSDATGNLILVETEGFNIIDPATNKFKWKKSFKIDNLDEVIPHEKGLIAVGKEEKKGEVALVSQEGKKIWNTGVDGYPYYITATSKGILYISTERSNILDFNKGKDVWKRDVKFKSIPAVTFDEEEDKVVLFENEKGYKFDLNSGEINLFAEDVELKSVKRKTPLVAEYIKGEGYLLYTDQHMSLLKPDGTVKYTDYYKPASSVEGLVGVAQLGLAFAGVDLDIKGSLDNIKMLSSLSNGAYRTSEDQTDGTSETSEIVGLYVKGAKDTQWQQVFSVTSKRFFNSKKTKDSQFIVTKVKRDDQPTIHKILKINKKTGEVERSIDLLDKTPNYVIDQVDNIVFLNEKNHLISAHKF